MSQLQPHAPDGDTFGTGTSDASYSSPSRIVGGINITDLRQRYLEELRSQQVNNNQEEAEDDEMPWQTQAEERDHSEPGISEERSQTPGPQQETPSMAEVLKTQQMQRHRSKAMQITGADMRARHQQGDDGSSSFIGKEFGTMNLGERRAIVSNSEVQSHEHSSPASFTSHEDFPDIKAVYNVSRHDTEEEDLVPQVTAAEQKEQEDEAISTMKDILGESAQQSLQELLKEVVDGQLSAAQLFTAASDSIQKLGQADTLERLLNVLLRKSKNPLASTQILRHYEASQEMWKAFEGFELQLTSKKKSTAIL